MSQRYNDEERRARLKIFMRKNKIRTVQLARETGYSPCYISTSLGSAGAYMPVRIVLAEAGIPEELLPPPRAGKKHARCVHSEQKASDSQA